MSSPGAGARAAMASCERPSRAPTSRISIPGPMISTMSGTTSTRGACPMVIMPTRGVMRAPLSLEDARVGGGPARSDPRAGIEADLPQLHRLQLEPFFGPEHVAHRLALIDHLGAGSRHHVVGLGLRLQAYARRPEGDRDGGPGSACRDRRAHARPSPRHLVAAEGARGEEVGVADEASHEDGGGGLVDLAGGAHLLEPAAAHHRDAVRHGERLALVVGDVDRGDPDLALELLELELHPIAELLVERAQRLVEEEHGRARDESPGQGHPLLLAARELARIARAVRGQLHEGEGFPHAPLDLAARHPRHAETKGHVLEHGAVGEEGVVLEDHAYAAAVGGHLVHALAFDEDVTCGRLHESRYRAQARGLAASGGAEEREELAPRHGHGDAVEGQRLPVMLDEATELDVGGGGGDRAQRSSLFQRSVHWGRCRATLAQSKSTSLSTSAGPLIILRATSGGSFTVLLVGLKKSSVAKAVCTSGERYMSTSFHASSFCLEPLVTWMTWSRMGCPSTGAAQSTGMPGFWKSYVAPSCSTAITTSFDSRYLPMVSVKSRSLGCIRLIAAMPASTSK